jgi:septal ring factor EnvC (AmiA/AmiB activator)
MWLFCQPEIFVIISAVERWFYFYLIEKLALSRKEVASLQTVNDNLSLQRTRLEESLAKKNVTLESMEMELKQSQYREEQLEENLEIVNNKMFALEEALLTIENKVVNFVVSFVNFLVRRSMRFQHFY